MKRQQDATDTWVHRTGKPAPPYQFEDFIGKGAYGRVFKAKRKSQSCSPSHLQDPRKTNLMDMGTHSRRLSAAIEDTIRASVHAAAEAGLDLDTTSSNAIQNGQHYDQAPSWMKNESKCPVREVLIFSSQNSSEPCLLPHTNLVL